MMIEIWLM